MEYHEIPAVIKSLTDENSQLTYAIKHDLEHCSDKKSGKIKVCVGNRIVKLDTGTLKTFLENQMVVNSLEIECLEDIHGTLTKVAVGLIK